MWPETRTSANTYCKVAASSFTAGGPGGRLVACLLFLALLVSCASGRHVGRPDDTPVPAVRPTEKQADKTADKAQAKTPSKIPGDSAPRPFYRPEAKDFSPSMEPRPERRQITASWYGADFHGRLTASGEPYNMHAMTCAHKELPFGTRLKVVSLSGGKAVECLVNDRGPFVAGRDLDLSYAAAKSIDLIGPGTAPVIIEPVGRDLRYVKYLREGPALSGQLTIQAGSFRDEGNARRLKAALELTHRDVYIMKAMVKGQEYYRVRVGKFGSRDEARLTGKPMAQEGYDVFITRYEQQI